MQFGSFVVPPLLSLAESNLVYLAATGFTAIIPLGSILSNRRTIGPTLNSRNWPLPRG